MDDEMTDYELDDEWESWEDDLVELDDESWQDDDTTDER